MQQLGEVVEVVGAVLATRVQFFGQREERPGVVVEVVDVKYGFRIGDAVLLQVVVETGAWRPALSKSR